jgi:hypothetical protein
MAGPPSEDPDEPVEEEAPVIPGGLGGVPALPSEEPAEIFASSGFWLKGPVPGSGLVFGSFLLSAIVIS